MKKLTAFKLLLAAALAFSLHSQVTPAHATGKGAKCDILCLTCPDGSRGRCVGNRCVCP